MSKRFGSFSALRDINIDFARGEVHALMGENGAGKSTMVMLIAGVHQPTEGALFGPLGQRLELMSPRAAIAAGIGVVHQELDLFDNMTVAENIALGPATGHAMRPAKSIMRARAMAALALLDENRIDPDALVGTLSTSDKQLVAISRALSENSSLILFDEPTSSLNSADAARLHAQIRALKAKGVTVVYISHKLGEVFDIADRVTVLRDGAHVSTREIGAVSYESLIADMLGHNPAKIFPKRTAAEDAPVALRVSDLHGINMNGVSFSVRRGEIVALAGLPGGGPTNALRAVYGLDDIRSGSITLPQRDGQRAGVPGAIRAGMAYLPSDRLRDGIMPLMSVVENIEATSAAMADGSTAARRIKALESITTLNVRTSDPGKIITALSGGNQQKALLARWLMMKPSLLLLDDPTRGVDIGSKAEIYHLLGKLADQGTSIVFTSSDSIELSGLADRILIFREGRVFEDVEGGVEYELLDRKITG
ncbi:sugar ABC transporter ATP-binding protein [Devosia sp. UYZn731]|uniref:sugar ABC transporter ATP-binding protein n=1 Tax=Devosia sp. UYZn731 TaxID=3156345 RepID=UPI003394A3A5